MFLSLITCLVLALVTQVLAATNYCSTQGNCFVQKASSYNVSTSSMPFIHDPGLHIEKVYQGLEFPTSIAFLNQSDIIVLEKNRGTVNRITNGSMHEEPLIDVNVSNLGERGLLGVATSSNLNTLNYQNKDKLNATYVFLYYTEVSEEGKEMCPTENSLLHYCKLEAQLLGNHLYRYELRNDKLVDPKLLLNLPATPNRHNGGRVLVGPDNNIYLVIGDIGHTTQAQNFINSSEPDGTGGILRITQEGKKVGEGILGGKDPIIKYYAYGIRNSFGLDFDPLTGNLWDTENGPGHADEINLVRPGFNSGWSKVQGVWDSHQPDPLSRDSYWKLKDNSTQNVTRDDIKGLVDFNGKGKYSAPELTWAFSVGPTAIKFMNSDKLGKKYENDIFVADFRNGIIYHFDLTRDRRNLDLTGPLSDKIANSWDDLQNVIWGQGFGAITDLEVGPDGYLYVVALSEGGYDCRRIHKDCITYDSPVGGSIFRIAPSKE